MARTIGAAVAGLLVWGVVAQLLDLLVRAAIPGYHAVEKSLAFTLPMMLARLALAAAASIGAGAVARAIDPIGRWAPWAIGIVLLLAFVPVHIGIGARLPIWYHLFFLGTILPFVGLGDAAMRARR